MSIVIKLPLSNAPEHESGCPDALLALVEYGDFACEFCGEAYIAVKRLQQHLGEGLKFIFRHYPLVTRHPLSLDAAVASEAAAQQGEFWKMHDMIFENQKYLTRSSFSRFAEEIGIEMSAFDNSRIHKKIIHKVINDFESGVKSGVDGTPTFFINGHRYTGLCDFQSLLKTCNYVMNFIQGECHA